MVGLGGHGSLIMPQGHGTYWLEWLIIWVMGIDGSLTREIVRRVLTVTRPTRIILFGSAAQGQMTPDSDIDLLVVEPSPQDTLQASVRIRGSLGGLDFPFDVMVISAERFEETKNLIGGIAYPANKYGEVIYEAS
jgi:predicted nucleotidyltransferase